MVASAAGAIHTTETSIHGRKRGRSRTATRYRGRGMRAMGRPFASAYAPFAYSSLPVYSTPTMIREMTPGRGANRIVSLDIVRGAVMVLMAIDHVRVYSGIPAGGPTPGIFFTRWVTHFCAPAFVFLAGTAAFLHGRKLNDTSQLARDLLTRGLLLVVLELTVIKFAWTFNFDYGRFILAGVIWMLGWCMVLLAGLIWLPTSAIGIIGLIVIFAQNVVGLLAQAMPLGSWGWIWQFLYLDDEVKLGPLGPVITVLYTIVPWIGVMAAGYAFGAIMSREPDARRRLCLKIGLSATALFVVLGGLAVFVRPAPEGAPPALFRFLNQNKYPASQLFLLMTLGPTIALLPLAERTRSWAADVLATFGRVPMFYYLLHIPVIHATALLVWLIRDGRMDAARFATAPYVSIPEAQRWGLPLLYLVFVIVVAMLYVPCRWFAGVKARRQEGWLRYL